MKMPINTVCRLCLAMDAPVHDIADSPLQIVYEKLTNISLNAALRPAVACYICFSQLRKCHNLMVKSVRAHKVLTQILQCEVKGESIAMLNHEAYQHTLSITPIELIAFTATQNNLMEEEIKQGLLSPQCVEEREMDRPACDEHLKFEESEDEGGVETTLLEEMDIEGPGLTDEGDMKQEELDPLSIYIFVEDIDIEEMTDGDNMKSAGAENMERKESEGVAPTEKCKKTHADKTQDGSTLTSHGKNILEKRRTSRTVIEEDITTRNVGSYMLRKKSANNSPISINTSMLSNIFIDKSNVCINSDNDCAGTNTDVDNSSSKQLKMFIRDNCSIIDDKCELMEHIETHNTVEKERNRKYSHQTKLNNPMFNRKRGAKRRESKNKRFLCDICPQMFTSKEGLNVHIRTHTGEKPFVCDTCNRRFSDKYALRLHNRIHTGEKPFECSTCNRRFSDKNGLKQHIRVHTGEKPFKCEKCKLRFRRKTNLNKHLLTLTHIGEKRFQCDMCNVRFTQKRSLKEHFKIHTGEKRYECDICKVRFTRKSILDEHVLTHTGLKPFECEICEVKFRQRTHLYRHFRIHTGEKPHQCEICRRRFSHKHHLSGHLRTHAVRNVNTNKSAAPQNK